MPGLGLGGTRQRGTRRGHLRGPRGPCLSAARAATAPGNAARAADRAAPDRVRGQGRGAGALGSVAVDIVHEPPPVCAPWSIDGEARRAGPPAAEAPTMAFVLPPRRLAEHAGEVGVVGALQETAGEMGQTLMGEDAHPGPLGLTRPKRALGLTPIADDRRGLGAHTSRPKTRPFPRTPPHPCQETQPGPRVAWGSWHGKSHLSSY